MKSRRYHLTYSAAKRNVLLLLLWVTTFEQIVLVASSSNNQHDNAESSSLFLKPGPDSILVSWPSIGRKNCNASGPTSFRLVWESDGRRRGERGYQVVIGCEFNLVEMKPCTTYDISVSPLDTSETTLKNTTTTLAKMPPAGDKLSTHSISSRSLALSWERPTTACEIAAYNITYSGVAKWGLHTEHTGSATIGRKEANNATSVVIAGLQPYTDYTFRVAAYNEAGEGKWALVNSTTSEGMPSKPRTLTTSSEALNTITATWREPEHSNGVLGQYNISWHRDEHTVGHTLVNKTMFLIVGLSPCVEYRVRLAATTGAGEGEYDEVKQAVIEASPVPTSYACGPDEGGETLTMTWTKPESPCNISLYEVSWTRASGTTHTKVVPSDNSAVYSLSSEDFKSQGQVCVAAEVEEKMGDQGCCSYGLPGGKGSSKSGGLIAVIVGIAVIIILIVAVVLIRKRKRKPQKETRRMGSLSSLTSIEQEFYSTLWANMKGNLELLKDNTILAAEFERLNKDSFVGEITAGLIPANRLKNRYNNMVPFDDSRVLLRKDGKDAEDYINASYVKSCVEDDVDFIACQGPLSNTIDDFWWMVWEQDVSTIVMLVNNNEGGKSKCSQYWPESSEILFSPFIIMLKSKEIDYGLIRRELLLKKGSEDRTIRHFQLVTWPDFGVPNNENELLMLVGDVRRAIQPKESYVVVHCSAGMGSTGTFIALWQLQVQAERQLPDINIRRTVLEMRNYRQMLVQKPAQYHYLHVCFIAYLEDIKRWRKPQAGLPSRNFPRSVDF